MGVSIAPLRVINVGILTTVNEVFDPLTAPDGVSERSWLAPMHGPPFVEKHDDCIPPAKVEVAVEVATTFPTVNCGLPVATRFDPFHPTRALDQRLPILRPMVPEVVIVPPVKPLFVATDVNRAAASDAER